MAWEESKSTDGDGFRNLDVGFREASWQKDAKTEEFTEV
jgi:hypothetical protein